MSRSDIRGYLDVFNLADFVLELLFYVTPNNNSLFVASMVPVMNFLLKIGSKTFIKPTNIDKQLVFPI